MPENKFPKVVFVVFNGWLVHQPIQSLLKMLLNKAMDAEECDASKAACSAVAGNKELRRIIRFY